MQWFALFQKEMVENWRNRKLIWVPLAFILIAILDPISTYYLPQLIELSGGLPEGAIIDIPKPAPEEVVFMSISQLNLFGVLIIILISMGTISGEIKSGVTELILTKPIKYHAYITAKWVAYLLLTLISVLLALLFSFYYIYVLFGHISLSLLLNTALFYSVWIIFVVTLTLFFNTLFYSPGKVAGSTIVTLLLMSLINAVFDQQLSLFPNKIVTYIPVMLQIGVLPNELISTAIMTFVLSILLIIIATLIFKVKEKTI